MVELQPFTEADWPTLIGWIDSPEFMMQWGGPAFSYPLDAAQLEPLLRAAAAKEPEVLLFKAVDSEDRQTVGHIQLLAIDRANRSARIGRVLVGPPHLRGRGIGTQMIRALLHIAFARLGLHRIDLYVFDFNYGAIACYEKSGFRRKGVLRDARKVGDAYWSLVEMSILEEEWWAGCTGAEGAQQC